MEQHRFPRRVEGQAIMLVALTLVILVAAAGLALDGANAFNQRRNTNNAVDIASMAGTRALVKQQEVNGKGKPINDAILDYLNQHLLPEGGTFAAPQVNYVDRTGQQIGTVDDATKVPGNAQGVTVQVNYTFNTYFMGIFSRDTLTVTAYGMSIYGPIGSAIGGDLVPLALDQSAAETFYLGTKGNTYSINLFDDDPLSIKTYDVYMGQIRQLSFKPGGSDLSSPGNSCSSGTPQDELSYWWCQGSQYQVYIGELTDGRGGKVSGSLRGEIQWRIDNRPIVLVPVYAPSPGGQYDIRGFLAIRLKKLTSDGIDATYVDYFVAPGAIVGQGNGLDTRSYAINLVR